MKVNYGDFEAHHLSAEVSGTYASEVDIDALAAKLDEKVFSLMVPQLGAARNLAKDSSFVHQIESD